MSIAQLWEDMYCDAVKRETQARQDHHEMHLRFIWADSQRASLIFQLTVAATSLKDTAPGLAQKLMTNIEEMEKSYEAKRLAKPVREAAGDSKPDAGFALTHRPTQIPSADGTTQDSPF